MQLHLGPGAKPDKQIWTPGKQAWSDRVTVDIDPAMKPDVRWDLNILPLPFEDDSADEIHAMEVLEHTGTQGDVAFYFAQWNDFYRILIPDGIFFGSCPDWRGSWAFGDPGHRRIISNETLGFLHRPLYDAEPDNRIVCYRDLCLCDFDILHSEYKGERFFFALRAVKPARPFQELLCPPPT
jgi:hypothetical protein